MVDNSFLDKLKKLLNKAQSSDSEAEAKALNDKVQELCLQHNIDMQLVSSHELESSNPLIEDKLSLDELSDKRHGKWIHVLIVGICRNYFTQCILTNHHGDSLGNLAVLGRKDNVATTIQMAIYLIGAIRRIEAQCWREYMGIQKRGAYRRDFLLACASRICQRMDERSMELRKEAEQREKSSTNTVTALIKLSNTEVSNFFHKSYPRVKATRGGRTQGKDGARAGYDAGGKISLNNQVGSGSNNRLLN